MISKKIRKIIAAVLLFTNIAQVAAATLIPINTGNPKPQNPGVFNPGTNVPSVQEPQSLSFSTNQLGITGPLNGGVTYSDLTGTFFNGQFLQKISDELGFNVLGEYGDKQYRINGTLGWILAARNFLKITAEQLSQELPFFFSTGAIDKQVKQNAVGARFQRQFEHSVIDNVSVGVYAAKAPNQRLDPVTFTSNGRNCNGFSPGFICITERNIAGANSYGADAGMGMYWGPSTYLEGKLFYDDVRYNTVFSAQSTYDKSGYGAGIRAQHLLASNLKFSAGAEARTIYNTYDLALSWMPPLSNALGTELSVIAQRVVSHNQTSDNNMLGLQVTFLADRVNYQAPIYGLNSAPIVDSIASWVSQPAVKMSQVMAVSEEFTHLAFTAITSISPNFGPLAGGNSVTITGVNFLPGAMVRFGDNIATITSMTATSLVVIVPAGKQLGGVTVSIMTPDGKVSSLENGYLYTNGVAPLLTGGNPGLGPCVGGTTVAVLGANFVPGETRVIIGDMVIPEEAVTVNSATSLTFNTPPHEEGTVTVVVATESGNSGPMPGDYTYIDAPTVAAINPTSGTTAGGTEVTVTGANFIVAGTTVTIGGIVIPASSVTVQSPNSLTFVTPAHAAGAVDVSVRTFIGVANVPDGYTYDDAAATVSALSPSYGPVAGGTVVTITGTNFVAGDTSVNIGGLVVAAALVTVNSPTSLTFTTPAHVAGNVSVTITTPRGTSGFVPGGFTYLSTPTATSLSPTMGPIAGGTAVTISGTHFVNGDTTVTIDNVVIPASSVIVNSSASLTFNTPAHAAGNVIVRVTTSGGVSNNVPGGFTYVDSPTASSLSVTSGTSSGGTSVTITGSNFVPGNTSVTIGGVVVPASSVTVNSPTSLTFITPAHVAGNVAVTMTTPGGTSGTIPGGFTYEDAPTASSLSQAFGPSAGGTTVTITGTNFVADDTTVTIGGIVVPAFSVTVNSATSLTFTTPPHAAGNVVVTVSTSVGTSGAIPGGFTYEDPPTATSLSPAFGSSSGGTAVTIIGTNFVTGDTSVTIGGVVVPSASVTVNSPTSLTFSTPAHVAGTVAVSVSTSAGTTNAIPGGFTYEDTPTATALSRAFGPTAGGTVVTVTGTNFVAGDTTVTIGGIVIPAASVIVNSDTSLTFTTPAHVAGNVAVSVATSVGSSGPIPGGFTYEDAPTATVINPAFGPSAGGTSVTITGTNFVAGDTTVIIGGTLIPAGSITVNSATSLTVTTPAHAAGSVAVTVSTSGGSSNVPGGYTYEDVPTATSISPAFGPSAGGTLVTITGTDFVANDTSVTIGGIAIAPASVTVNSSTSLTFSTPAHAAGNVNITVSTSGGTSNAIPGGYTYEDVPTATAANPAFGPSAGGTSVTITGTNFVVGDTSVTIGGIVIPAASVTVNSTTSLTFTTSAHAAGNVVLTVSTSGGSGSLPGGFTYEDVPTAASLNPAFGPTAGGTLVMVTGTNFVVGDTSVTIGGIVTPATVKSATELTFTTPAHAAGNVVVNVSTSGGSVNVPGGFTYSDTAATVSSLTPAFGPSAGGTVVTITGTNFEAGTTSVTIGGILVPAASVTVNSATELTFSTPAHAAGNVSVNVTTSFGSSGFVPGGFTYEDAPTASSLNPTSGPTLGGTVVTVTGANFVAGDTAVTIDGVDAGAVTVNSATELTFTTPAHAAGNVDVTVSTSGGISAAVPGGFTYNNNAATATSLSPVRGPVAGGTTVTITGTNFEVGTTSVTIDGVVVPAGSVSVNSATELTFATPAHAAGNVAVNVTTSAGASGFVPGGFTYQDVPTATSLSPAFGPVAGGTSVTIIGTNFVVGDTSVTIGGNVVSAASVTVNSATSLTFSTPAHAAGAVAVTVSTSGGTTAAIPGGFTYENAPTATSLAPAFGPVAGGTSVTITGTNFVASDTSVTIGGIVIPAASVTVNSATSLTFSTPAHAAGAVAVTVSTSGGTTAAIPGGFTYENAPTATSLTPAFGPVAGGTSVTITGTNFVAGDTSVTIGGNVVSTASVTVNSATSLTFSTPAHAAGNVAVTVSTSGGISAAIPGGFTYVSAPTATSLTPAFGPVAGGTSVTITGTNFVAGDTSVTIGGIVVSAASVTVNSATSLTFSTPAHAAGTVAVTVSTSGGTSAAIPGGFTYENAPTATSLTPAFGPVAGGTSVTITGTNFVAGDTSVTIGGNVVTAASVTVNSATSLTFSTPAHAAGTVAVTVSTSGGTTAAIPGGFTYEDAPTATSLAPAYGPVAGGTSVTITGTNFVAGDTSVTIGGVVVLAASVTVNSATSLTFSTPAHAAGNVAVTVSTSGGTTAAIPGGFTYESVPTATSLSPTSGPIAGGTSVTVTGANFVAGDTSVTIGGNFIAAASVAVNSATSLTFSTPAHAAGNVAVSVSTSGGSANVPGGFTYLNAPTATSLTPTSGTTAGGTTVTITGTSFVTGATSVTIGGMVVSAASVTVSSATSLNFSTPAHAAGNVAVSVTTAGGTSGTIPGGYTYLAPSLNSCTAPLPSVFGVQLVTCVGANLTLFETTYLKASGSAACSTFPTQSVVPSVNVLGKVLVSAINIPGILVQGLIGCQIQLCSDSSCSAVGGVAGPTAVSFGL